MRECSTLHDKRGNKNPKNQDIPHRIRPWYPMDNYIGEVYVTNRFSFLFCPIMCFYVLSSVLWCPLRFPHKNDVRFVFTSSCVCLRIVVSNTFFVVFFFVLCTLCCQFLWIVHFWLSVKTNRTSFLCGNRNGHHNTELRT
jgi:hypothetical protein